MSSFQVYLNYLPVDVKSIEGIPLTFEIGIDGMDNLVSVEGAAVDNTAKRLIVELTNKTLTAIGNVYEGPEQKEKGFIPVQVVAFGSTVFVGSAKYTGSVLNSGGPGSASYDLDGDIFDPLTRLENVDLNELDLGSTTFNESAVRGSWINAPGDCDKEVYFGLVRYITNADIWINSVTLCGTVSNPANQEIYWSQAISSAVPPSEPDPTEWTILTAFQDNRILATPVTPNPNVWYSVRYYDTVIDASVTCFFCYVGATGTWWARIENRQWIEMGGNQITLYAADASVLWAPVYYGKTVGGTEDLYLEDLRPHISNYSYFTAIWERYLGLRIQGEFIPSWFYKQTYYIYGAGNNWKRTDVSQIDSLAQRTADYSPGIGDFDIPWDTITDPWNQWINSVDWAPTGNPLFVGYYVFEGEIETEQVEYLTIHYPTRTGQDTYQVFLPVDPDPTGPYKTPFRIEGYNDGTGTFKVEGNFDVGGRIIDGSYVEIKLSDEVGLGSRINLATCTHPNPVKNYLAGEFHKYGLLARVDLGRGTVTIEPRFPYTVWQYNHDLGTWEEFTGKGYYQPPNTADADKVPVRWDDRVDIASISKSVWTPFGDDLIIGYKKTSNDPVIKDVLKTPEDEGEETAERIPPVYGVKLALHDRREKPRPSRNPYFHPAPNASYNEIKGAPPLISLLKNYEEGNDLPEPTFEAKPTTAIYYGLSGVTEFFFEGSVDELPLLYMQPPFSRHVDGKTCLSYSDTSSGLNRSMGNNTGLFMTFHLQFGAIMKEAERMVARTLIYPDEIHAEDFRSLRYIRDALYIFIKVSKYQPAKNSFADGIYMKWALPLLSILDDLVQDQTFLYKSYPKPTP